MLYAYWPLRLSHDERPSWVPPLSRGHLGTVVSSQLRPVAGLSLLPGPSGGHPRVYAPRRSLCPALPPSAFYCPAAKILKALKLSKEGKSIESSL
ncbi:Guanine Nucleotide Exchange Factor For Rab-3A [Manis pentadactyla]|nr:Guanine Nucleotide Exchange Factor For Rab-3A [Manis pentadactyla]